MADLRTRLALAHRALETLEELELDSKNSIIRDAAIQRFAYTFEAIWKAAKAVLRESFGVDLASPKPVIRACYENGLLEEEETRLALAMADHQNLTAHTYNVKLAEEIFAALPAYRFLIQSLKAWIDRHLLWRLKP